MFNLGMGEITVILLLALIFIGPKKLPEMASGLGRLIREFRKTTQDVKNEIQLDDAIRKPFEELREAVTLHPDELKRRDNLRKELERIRKAAEEAEAAQAAAEPTEGAASETPNDAAATGTNGEMSTLADAAADAAAMSEMPATPGPEVIRGDLGAETGERRSSAAMSAVASEAPASESAAPPAFSPPTAAPEGTVARTGGLAPLPARMTPPTPMAASGHGPTSSSAGAGPVTTGAGLAAALAAIPSRMPKPPSGPTHAPAQPRKSAPAMTAAPPPQVSAADAANTTQILSEDDLQAAAVSPPPPPPRASGRMAAQPPPVPPSTSPRLPGATPPKKPT